MKLLPIEDEIYRGLQERITRVFDCPSLITTANDKVPALKRMLGGKQVTYPFIFIIPQTQGTNPDSYVSSRLARQGLPVTVVDDASGTAYAARILPSRFDFRIEYVTNLFQGSDSNAVTAFTRRWLMARRLGFLKFNVNYGRLSIPIGCTMDESISMPEGDNKVLTETDYLTVANLTIAGYISEPELKEIAVIQNLLVNGILMNADGSMPGNSQFFSFTQE